MATEYKNIKRKYHTAEASLSLLAKQWGYGEDTRRLVACEDDGSTKRYYWDSTRLADQTGTYGAELIGIDGITGVTPDGGSSGAAATLRAMLRGMVSNISGTIDYIPRFSATHVLADSIMYQLGSFIGIQSNVNSLAGLTVLNNSTGVDSSANVIIGNNVGSATLFMASAAYTADNAIPASCLNVSIPSGLAGFNFLMRGATDPIKMYFGSPASGTLFHTFSNKGLKIENLSLSTDANGVVAGTEQTVTLTKNDSNVRQFYTDKIVATLNAGGSNANTTLDLLHRDTVNTATTGMTTNLFNFKYGGNPRLLLMDNGILQNGNSSIEETGSDSATMTNAPTLSAANPYKWIRYRTSDGSYCTFPVWKLSS